MVIPREDLVIESNFNEVYGGEEMATEDSSYD